MRRALVVLVPLLALLATASAQAQPVLFVDADAVGASTGASWADAFPDLQDALAAARADGTVEEVWIAEGTYTPTADGDRSVSFDLVSGVGLYGGFAGKETERDEADPALHLTVLSGDIGGADAADNSHTVVQLDASAESALATTLDGVLVERAQGTSAQVPSGGILLRSGSLALSRVVVRGNASHIGGGIHVLPSATPNTLLLLRSLVSENDAQEDGGGIAAFDAQVEVRHSTIQGNSAFVRGGGGFFQGGTLLVDSTAVQSNSAGSTGGSSGGGLYLVDGQAVVRQGTIASNQAPSGGGLYQTGQQATLRLEDMVVRSNTAFGSGGGLYIREGTVQASRSVIATNEAGFGEGGGMFIFSAAPQRLDRVSFLDNEANDQGGALYTRSSGALITNSLFYGNGIRYAGMSSGAAIYSSGGSETLVHCVITRSTVSDFNADIYGSTGPLSYLRNSIVWANSGFELGTGSRGRFSVSHSIVSGGYAGPGVLSADPDFAGEISRGPDGLWGTADDDFSGLRVLAGSPALDAGSAALLPADDLDLDGDGDVSEPLPVDFAGDDRVDGAAPDLGVYEGAAPTPLGPTVYVDADATGASTGMSWADAFPDLQMALALARDTSLVEEIWIAEGTYTPTDDGDRSVSFDLVSGVGLYGGFDGTEMERDEADPIAHPTVLSGNVGDEESGTDNSFHVVTATGLSDLVEMDGFVIRDGFVARAPAGGSRWAAGGGLLVTDSALSLSRCEIIENRIGYQEDPPFRGRGAGLSAVGSDLALRAVSFSRNAIFAQNPVGGGLHAGEGTTIYIEGGAFEDNSANTDKGGIGGGLAVETGATAEVNGTSFVRNEVASSFAGGGGASCAGTCTMRNVSFIRNRVGLTATSGGGLDALGDGGITLQNARFIGNEANRGAGLAVSSGNLSLHNAVFIGNVTRSTSGPPIGEKGGGGLAASRSSATISHVTFAHNVVTEEAKGSSILVDLDGTLNVSHFIAWPFPNSVVADESSNLSLIYGIAASTLIGTDLLAADPLFIREPSPGPDDLWGTDDDDYGDLRLRWDSPAVDAGDASLLPPDMLDLDGDGNTTEPLPLDADGNARVMGTALDLGAYESPFNVAAEDEPALPTMLALTSAPNPFARASTVTLALPAAGDARVAAYDVLGRRVAVLHDGPLAAGRHPMALGDGLAPGLYLVRATVDDGATTLRVTKSR